MCDVTYSGYIHWGGDISTLQTLTEVLQTSSTARCSLHLRTITPGLYSHQLLGKRIRQTPRPKVRRMSAEALQKKKQGWEGTSHGKTRSASFFAESTSTKGSKLPVFDEAWDDTKDVVLTCPPPSEEEEQLLRSVCRLTEDKMKTLKSQMIADLEEMNLTSNILIHISHAIKLNFFDIFLLQCKKLVALGFVPCEKNKDRSETPAVHVGVWRCYTLTPNIVSEVWQKDAPADKVETLRALIRDICAFFKKNILPKVLQHVEYYYPDFFKLQRIIADQIGKAKGSSEFIHLDHLDAKFFLPPTVIVTGGNFSGVDLNVPQLGGRMPIKAGNLVAGNMRTLAHGEWEGRTCWHCDVPAQDLLTQHVDRGQLRMVKQSAPVLEVFLSEKCSSPMSSVTYMCFAIARSCVESATWEHSARWAQLQC
ncbi:hypothetical protein GGX14DRAFT_384362 [Mycena pura]|uniref:Uncharacterized protein n=1 Tax=Mycena pura TaxID=153505 RepID=A0AAD7E5W1_9AGAR|nr:hypothetical protein GGX14DRAFT_384362 [Mycena pura]